MTVAERPTAIVETHLNGDLNVVLTVPAPNGSAQQLSLYVHRHEETGEWLVYLPLWPKGQDLEKPNYRIFGLVTCYVPRPDAEPDEDLNFKEEDCDMWSVDESGTATPVL